MSPALAGRFLSTVLPGKSYMDFFLMHNVNCSNMGFPLYRQVESNREHNVINGFHMETVVKFIPDHSPTLKTTHGYYLLQFSSVQFSSVAQSCPTLCDPMNRSRPGLPVHHQLPKFTQTHIHQVSDAIQPSHPLSSPSPPAPKSLPASESFPMSQLFT